MEMNLELVYTQPNNFNDKASPTFSHHKLTVFEYADGVNEVSNTGLTDLQMYYAKLSNMHIDKVLVEQLMEMTYFQ